MHYFFDQISPNLHHLLPKDEPPVVELVDPWSLFTPARIDLIAKYIYGSQRLQGLEHLWGRELYDAHIKVFNGYVEADGSYKCGIQDFLTQFDALLDSIDQRGFDANQSIVPVTMDGVILDGAHRVAAAAVYNKPVAIVRVDATGPDYGYRYFQANGLDQVYLDSLSTSYCEQIENSFVIFIWPSAQGRNDELENLISQHSKIICLRSITLTGNGPTNIMRQVYRTEPWLGTPEDGFLGARNKADWCFQKPGPLRAFLVQSDLKRILALKTEIRQLFEIDNHSVHINDTHEEAALLAQIAFSEPTLHYLNMSSLRPRTWFTKLFDQYERWLSTKGFSTGDFCIDGSAIMAAYGLREARDLDYICLPSARDACSGFKEIGCHNNELSAHGIAYDQWIVNPNDHFYINGLKFATLPNLAAYKKLRAEEKDLKDVALIESAANAPVHTPTVNNIIHEIKSLSNPSVLLYKARFIALKMRFHITMIKKRFLKRC